ncbi:MAG TPA: LLM class flavin-dependent oxidoreductase [Miltoncostaeaceae bacterium]|nr:LLM class flavin-dependent oxidoreductase [Miltoncostaeaceae bacterium]
MATAPPLRFGVFIAPFHAPEENPTLALERDLELIALCDRLGYDEAWVGEHHSTGWETIASPELFLAVAAERTRHIRLGTGAVSLPYHHPLMVADRIVLLDHLTRGRIEFGVGPGGHISDALMLGLDPARLRDMMAESLEVILRLMTDPTPLTRETDWFTLRDAVLQLRPRQWPHPPVAVTSLESPAGMRLAGRVGAGVLSLTVAKASGGSVDLRRQWAHAEEAAAEAARAVDRRAWRLVVPVHVAETRAQAVADVREGGARHLLEYVEATTGRPCPVPGPPEQVVAQMAERGAWLVGTPDDLVDLAQMLQEVSGGFGGLLLWGHEWAPTPAIHRSYELIARYAMPRLQGALDGLASSNRVARARAGELHQLRTQATQAALRRAGAPPGEGAPGTASVADSASTRP